MDKSSLMNCIYSILRSYFSVIYLIIFTMISLFWHYADSEYTAVKLYILAASAGYAALYLLPAILLTRLILWRHPGDHRAKLHKTLAYFTAWITTSAIVLIIYTDYQLYQLYEYHFNSFVWNLMTTPGGIAALGITPETEMTATLQTVLIITTNAGLLWLIKKIVEQTHAIPRTIFASFLGLMMLALATEEMIYAHSVYTGNENILEASKVIPFHLKSSAKSFFHNLGIPQTGLTKLKVAQGEIKYPIEPIHSQPLDSDLNIIMLVAESFRWDLYTPEITPHLWQLGQKASVYQTHYSGGNRTRMGLLSMFYGIYAPYWYSFEKQQVGPVLMNVLQEKNYQLAIHTSQSFDYPELRHTTFHGIDEQFLQELQTGEPWARDRQNITDIIQKLKNRQPDRPFYTFMFFESTHAPYTFPDEAVIRPHYLREMNYAKLNLLNNIDGIHNRYINAAHHIDAEVGRLLDYLENNQLMENTIVLFTGDHGEEFMEKGHWGHGHNKIFPDEQTRVPLLIKIPGQVAETITRKTSHIQIPATLLKKLGVPHDPFSYSSADDLTTTLPYLIMGNYNYMTVFKDKYKVTFPFTSSDYFHYAIYDDHDVRVPRKEKTPVLAFMQPTINEVLKESNRFVH